jgi:hypothetical protein
MCLVGEVLVVPLRRCLSHRLWHGLGVVQVRDDTEMRCARAADIGIPNGPTEVVPGVY